MPHIPIHRPAPPPPTFGELRRRWQAFTVACRRCGHERRFTPKESQFLKERLRSDLELASAVLLFRCTQCNGGVVKITPEPLDWPTNL